MRHALKNITKSRSSNASVVDGKLILSFPDALTPVVWQMDLTQTKASALEVREDKDEKTFTLTLTNPKSEQIKVASFEKRDRAIDGLMAASEALGSAHGQIRPTGANNNAPNTYKNPNGIKWPRIIIGLIVLIILLSVWTSMNARNGSSIQQQATPNTSNTPNAQSDTVGVPMSADDFLRGQ